LRKWILLLGLLLPSLASAQLARYNGTAFSNAGRPLGGVYVAVCSFTATNTAQPCTPAASIFYDVAGTQPITQPLQADGGGNYGFWVASGNYQLQIYGNGVTTQFGPISVGGTGGGSTCTGTANQIDISGGCIISIDPILQLPGTVQTDVASSTYGYSPVWNLLTPTGNYNDTIIAMALNGYRAFFGYAGGINPQGPLTQTGSGKAIWNAVGCSFAPTWTTGCGQITVLDSTGFGVGATFGIASTQPFNATTSGVVSGYSFAATGAAGNAGYDGLKGGTTFPTLVPNNAGWLGPSSASFSAYACSLPATAPSNATPILSCATPNGAGVSVGTWVAAPGGSITWPATSDLVISNSTNSPAGLAPVNGDCVLGSGGAWTAGTCPGATPGGSNFSVQYDNSGALGGTSVPAINGTYNCGYTITASTGVAPTCPQVGLSGTSGLTGSVSSYTVLYSDNGKVINHDAGATGTVAVALPTATTLVNSNFFTNYCNQSTQTDVITPTTWTINYGATLNVGPNICYRIHVDPNHASSWIADASGLPGSGYSVVQVDTTGLTANVSATTLLTPASNGFYRFSCFIVETTHAGTSSTLPSCQVNFTDANSSTALSIIAAFQNANNTVGSMGQATDTGFNANSGFYAKSGVAITYSTVSYASNPASTMTYAIHIRLEGPF
jgi:hypothetical protein